MKTDWQMKKIGEVCQIINGGTPDTKNPKYWDGDIFWITPKDMGKMTEKYVSNTIRKISLEGLKNSSAKILPIDSVILSSRAPIGHLAINKVDIATNQGCKGLIPNKNLNPLFLYYFLNNSVDLLNSLGSGTTFKELSGTKLSEVIIPLPPLAEQQRIVKILDEVFEKTAKAKEYTQKNLQNSKDLFDSYLHNIFKSPGKDWEEKKLGEVCIVERGSSPRPIEKYITNSQDGVNWIKIGDTKYIDKYLYTTKYKITKEGAEKSRYVKEGDFILSNSMSFGKPYIMKTEGYIHDGWFVLRLPESIDTEFFWFLLVSPFTMNQFISLASGAIVKNISGDLVKKVTLPIPPLPEQKEIVIKLTKLSSKSKLLESIYQKKLSDLEELKKTIMNQAFSGNL